MKQVVFKVDEELFKEAKVKAVMRGQNMTEYLISLIKKDLGKEKDGAGHSDFQRC